MINHNDVWSMNDPLPYMNHFISVSKWHPCPMKVTWANTDFVLSAPSSAGIPQSGLPQLAVAGHSNVGKSSLLNSLLERRGLMRTSKKPGCTRLLNVFNVDQRLTLVDLPGYGFARAPKQEKKKWAQIIESYLLDKQCKKRLVLLLIDARHGPKASDLQLMHWLNDQGVRWHPVATKIDKLTAQMRKQRTQEISNALGGSLKPLLTSSLKKNGLQELRQLIIDELLTEDE